MDNILVERSTHSVVDRVVSDADKSDVDPEGENSIVLNTHLYDASTHILDRPSRSSSLAAALIQTALHTHRNTASHRPTTWWT
jgi:hypothetical protein